MVDELPSVDRSPAAFASTQRSLRRRRSRWLERGRVSETSDAIAIVRRDI
jgi:hypothetical protein